MYEIKPLDNDEENFGDAKTLGDVYKSIASFISVDICAEDYINTLLLRYNSDKSEKNQNKLEAICFKNHHMVFYNLMDMLRLVEYVNFKTPSLSILYHFLNDKSVLTKMKDVFENIINILGNEKYLEFYMNVLDEIEKRVKKPKETSESWVSWFVSSVSTDEKGVHSKIDDDDNDGVICDNDEENENNYDDEDMYVVFSNINEMIKRLFCTWERVFILNSKNLELSDCFANLMKQHLSISMKQNQFENSLENPSMIAKSKHEASRDSTNVSQLITVS